MENEENEENEIIEQLRFYLCINESKHETTIFKEHQILLNGFLHAQSENEYFRLHEILKRTSEKLNNGMSSKAFKYWEYFLKYMNKKIHKSFYNM